VALNALREKIDALVAGQGEVVSIEGPPGTGKSALLDVATQMAAQRKVRVLAADADPASHTVPLGPILQALTTGDDPIVSADDLVRLAHPDQRFWLIRELQHAIEVAALREPLMIVLDDLQWADVATLGAIGSLSRQLTTHRVLWLLSLRSEALSGELKATLGLVGGPSGTELVLDLLDEAAVLQMSEDLIGAAPDDALSSILQRAEGQPFLLVEMVEALRGEQRISLDGSIARLVGTGMPTRFVDSVQGRLADLSPEGRHAVQMASILGRQFTVAELADMIDRPPGALVQSLQEAIASGLLDPEGERLTFRHDLLRDAVRAALPESVRNGLQRQAIEVMSRHGVRPAEFANLVAEVAETGDSGSVDLLRRAAAEVGRVSPSVAVGLSRRALELTTTAAPERNAIAAETLNFLVDAGRIREAEKLLDQVGGDLVDPATEVQVRLHIGLLMLQYLPSAAVEQCRRGLRHEDIPMSLRAQLLSLMARGYDLLGDFSAEDDTVDRIAAEPFSRTDPLGEMMRLTPEAMVRFAVGDWRSAMRLSEGAVKLQASIERPTSRLWAASAWQALLMISSGLIDEAFLRIDPGVRSAEEEGLSAALRVWSMLRCRALFAVGRLADATAEAETTIELGRDSGQARGGYLNHIASFVLGSVALHTGERGALDNAVASAERMSGAPCPNSRRLGAWLGTLLAHAAGSRQKLDVDLLDPLATGRLHAGSGRQHSDSVQLVRMLIATDQAAEAQGVIERLEVVDRKYPDFPFLHATSLHARSLLDQDPARARQAAELHRIDPRRLVRASAAEDAGRLLFASERDAAIGFFDEALGLYAEVGAERDVARVRGLLRSRGVRRVEGGRRASSEWPELTKSELAVVREVARGATNREAAQRLYLSPYTVNSHLRHVFDKLGIRSRVDLARIAAERELPGADPVDV